MDEMNVQGRLVCARWCLTPRVFGAAPIQENGEYSDALLTCLADGEKIWGRGKVRGRVICHKKPSLWPALMAADFMWPDQLSLWLIDIPFF